MPDSNHYSGEIAIDPPLTWKEVQAGPPVKDIRLKLREQATDTEFGQTKVVTATAIIPREACFGDHQMAEDIQSVVDHYGADHQFSGFIEVLSDPGYGDYVPRRHVAVDGRVETVKAQIVWPGASRFPVVTICGSMRFRAEMDEAAQQLSRDGFIVLMPFVTFTADEQLSDPDKAMLDQMHRAKIDLSGSIHVVNPGGYIGESTRGEIAYAVATGKGISAIEQVEAAAAMRRPVRAARPAPPRRSVTVGEAILALAPQFEGVIHP